MGKMDDDSNDKVSPDLWKFYFMKSWDEVCAPLRNVEWIAKGGEGKELVVASRR